VSEKATVTIRLVRRRDGRVEARPVIGGGALAAPLFNRLDVRSIDRARELAAAKYDLTKVRIEWEER